MIRTAPLALVAAALLAGCGKSDSEANAPSPKGFVPPVTQAPEPVAGQRPVTPITAHVGKYPRDAVDGVSFYDRTDVSNILVDDVPREDARRLITGQDAVSTPIFRLGSRVAAHGCEPQNCADRNWTVLVAADGDRDRSTVCFYDAETMGGASTWTTRAGTTRRPGACPQG